MTYAVKEVFLTLQGEGARTGRPAVFLRFSGCNLWSGREETRASAICRFCDTDFVGTDGDGGGTFTTADDLAAHVEAKWVVDRPDHGRRYVVCTGGEPLLQLDAPLIDALHDRSFEIAVESNGTINAPADIDWLTISPKVGAALVQRCGDELKLVYPQEGGDPDNFEDLGFDVFYLQPMDGPDLLENTKRAVDYVRRNPRWSLSVQTHKVIGIP